VRYLICVALMVISFGGHAGWLLVRTDVNGNGVFVNPATVGKADVGVSAWFLTNKGKSDQAEASYKSLMEFNCTKERVRVLQSVFMTGQMGEGRVVRVVSVPSSWNYIAPDSMADAVKQFICSR